MSSLFLINPAPWKNLRFFNPKGNEMPGAITSIHYISYLLHQHAACFSYENERGICHEKEVEKSKPKRHIFID